jgi:hypothetical protein
MPAASGASEPGGSLIGRARMSAFPFSGPISAVAARASAASRPG